MCCLSCDKRHHLQSAVSLLAQTLTRNDEKHPKLIAASDSLLLRYCSEEAFLMSLSFANWTAFGLGCFKSVCLHFFMPGDCSLFASTLRLSPQANFR